MLEVVAIKYNNIAPVLPISCQLPEEGGSIGRDEDNAVALPDPLRLLSRRHLLITPEGQDTYKITNISTANPAIINDIPLAPGESRALHHDDTICIGSYLLQVHIIIDPEAPPEPLPSLAEDILPAADIDGILDQGGTPALTGADALGLTMQQPGIGLADLAVDGMQLLADVEPSPSTARLTQDPLMESESPLLQEDTLDPLALFGDPGAPLEDWLGTPSPPKKSSSTSHGIGTPSRPVNELHTPFSLAAPADHMKAEATAAAPPALLIPDEFALDDLLRDQNTAAAPETGLDAPFEVHAGIDTGLETDLHAPVAVPESTAAAVLEPEAPPSAAAKPEAIEQDAVTTTTAEDAQTELGAPPQDLPALHAALLQGLGLDTLPMHPQLTPDLMRLLGALLRSAIDGTLKLIAARTAVKREVRANITVISPERNNPLKFSPDANVALLYLLGRDHPGFMPAEDAMRQAFADLLSHQVGVISGMRAALSLVLERFDPQTISTDTGHQGMLEQLIPMARKARLWEAYGRYFEQAQEQAQDRFQEFFGAAFVDAYEDHTTPTRASAGSPPEACH